MTEELKPCPFCASHDVELRESITDAYVACNNCGCRTGFVFLGASDPSKANKLIEVAEVWNTRPNTPPAVSDEALVERIVEAVIDSANLVAHDGYYEIDQESACRAILPIIREHLK